MQITTVGLDLAKNVFQVHAINAAGEVVVRRALRRAQMLPFFEKLAPCLVGIEACGTSHHWARELVRLGHEVRLMPPAYVKAYVKRGKTDAADAEAICEAVTRPTMRFVRDQVGRSAGGAIAAPSARSAGPPADPAGQHDPRSAGGVRREHPARDHPRARLRPARRRLVTPRRSQRSPPRLSGALSRTGAGECRTRFVELERELMAWYRARTLARRIATVPGVGLLGATALAAHGHRSWPVPLRSPVRGLARAHPAAELQRRQGAPRPDLQDGRPLPAPALVIVGMTSLVRQAKCGPGVTDPRLAQLLARKPARVATVAMANRAARVIWAIMTRGGVYRAHTGRLGSDRTDTVKADAGWRAAEVAGAM